MDVIALEDLEGLLDREVVMRAVRDGFIAHAEGRTQLPPPTHLMFEKARGDCHVKCCGQEGHRFFVVKVATGFYDNAHRGEPVNDGLVMLFDARTGRPRAQFLDRGWLTSWRTAAAGALVAQAMCDTTVTAIGVFGAGHQARLQLDWLRDVVETREVWVYGRRPGAMADLARDATRLGYRVHIADSARELLAHARLVVTTTPATVPLFDASDVQPGTHITAIGADAPGKQELDPTLFARAAAIVVDDLSQCLHHGDLGHAVRAGTVAPEAATSLGRLLSPEGPTAFGQREQVVTVADLTGLAVQDLAIATAFLDLFTPPAAAIRGGFTEPRELT